MSRGRRVEGGGRRERLAFFYGLCRKWDRDQERGREYTFALPMKRNINPGYFYFRIFFSNTVELSLKAKVLFSLLIEGIVSRDFWRFISQPNLNTQFAILVS
jgi:hypothetical protein